MSFHTYPAMRATPGFPLGVAVSLVLVIGTLIAFAALALTGVGLIEW